MSIRAIFFLVILLLGNTAILAAPNCPVPPYTRKTTSQIADWYEKYVSPFRVPAGTPDGARLTKDQIEALAERMEAFHHSSVGNVLQFEALVQQIAVKYAGSMSFKGLDSGAAEKIYRPGSGPSLDFSALCIDTRSISSADDTFAITLFGVRSNDCQRSGLRGLVFTNTLVNGATEGECRPDDVYYKNLIIPVSVGTNAITFVCGKDTNGCSRR